MAIWVRMAPQAYPLLESLHILGIALLVGGAIVVDLRLMGLGGRHVPVTTVTRNVLPLCLVGFAAAAISGGLMFTGVARAVGLSAAAPWKLGLILISGVNILIFHVGIYRSVHAWDQAAVPPWPARIAGALSMIGWVGVLVAGRYLAYV
ncbi:DUF6644 family protein [Salipiger mucosus]|uniref:DUF6644 domain-containing protein n=1 Tax=Salipiger mucosus DSM 16094 TaxID=1123237 RepID=S9RX62_9RHOB|nr:DUF6644 family protein [Salipiger mucosus]EPX82585.1 hypothetical protein Salmuc_00904 [Salipiger mucosus DSM 16094]